MASTAATIDEYISGCPPDVQPILEEMRNAILRAAPESGQTITYQIPTITFASTGKQLVCFAAWRHHVSIYPLPAVDDALESEVAPYRSGQSTAKFPLSKPVPYDLIERLTALLVVQRGN